MESEDKVVELVTRTRNDVETKIKVRILITSAATGETGFILLCFRVQKQRYRSSFILGFGGVPPLI